MKDIHSHLLHGIDDGTSSIEESVYIIKELIKRGYTDLVLTPHYIEDTKYNTCNKDKEIRIQELKKTLKENEVNINLYLGNEIFISGNIYELLKNKKVSSLASSKYILIEYSLYYHLSNDEDILLDLLNKGYIPILAHPERYEYYQDNIGYFRNLVNKGVLLQGNLFSLTDTKNKRKKNLLSKLLKENLIHFLCTDIHKKEDLKLLDKSLIELNKLLPWDKQQELLNTNISNVISSKENKISIC